MRSERADWPAELLGGRGKKIAAFAIAIAIGPLAIALKAFWVEYASFRSRPTPVDHAAARLVVPQLVEVSWSAPSGTLRGWFVPGQNRAAIVLVHGAGGNRGDVLAELKFLSRAGFSLLAFDWPGQGESDGLVTWDEPERAAVRSALDWLALRSEVDPDRIGAFGFSSGGYPLIQVAVEDRRIRALAVASTPADMIAFGKYEYRSRGPLTQLPAFLAMRLRGMHLDEQIPTRIIAELAPRPLFVVLGEGDVIVPAAMTRPLFEAAGEPKELLALPGVGHGEYAKLALPVYEERLTAFFSRSLRAPDEGGLGP
jgi:uncharacterized protein